MAQIIPIKDLRDTTKISELCNHSNEPIFITKNGYGDMVIMSMATYEKRLYQLDMYYSIMEGKRQADNGQIIDGEEFFAKLEKKYGK